MQARIHLAVEPAEAQDHGVLVGGDDEEEGKPGGDDRAGQHEKEDQETGRTSAARDDLLEPVLAPLQELLKIGLLMRPSRRALSPGTAPTPSATTATLIVPRHRYSPFRFPSDAAS